MTPTKNVSYPPVSTVPHLCADHHFSSLAGGKTQFIADRFAPDRGDGNLLPPKKPCLDTESLASFLRYIGLPHAYTCQPAAGSALSLLLTCSEQRPPLSPHIAARRWLHGYMTNERGCANAPQISVRHPQQRPRNEQVAPLQLRLLSAPASIRVRLSSFLRAPTRHISKG